MAPCSGRASASLVLLGPASAAFARRSSSPDSFTASSCMGAVAARAMRGYGCGSTACAAEGCGRHTV